MEQVLDSACHSEEYQEFAEGQNLTAASGFGCVLFNLERRGFSALLDTQPRCCWMPLPNASAVSFIIGFWFRSPPSACLPAIVCSLLSVSISHSSRMRKKDFYLWGRHGSSHTALELRLQRKKSYCQLLPGDVCLLVVTLLDH